MKTPQQSSRSSTCPCQTPRTACSRSKPQSRTLARRHREAAAATDWAARPDGTPQRHLSRAARTRRSSAQQERARTRGPLRPRGDMQRPLIAHRVFADERAPALPMCSFACNLRRGVDCSAPSPRIYLDGEQLFPRE